MAASSPKERILITLPQPEPKAVVEKLKTRNSQIESIKYVDTTKEEVSDGRSCSSEAHRAQNL